ncbi:MAG: hypothetical protein KatS3mg101_0160 [Patescibacteria group bacterium]|nr:MAG: hypothetical protein KatS3mg101_0160 [Patescibacteria group bacterium]
MFGNYPVNDDWVFFWQVKAFSEGIFKLNAELDPSFVVQGVLGLFWSKIFGLSYISLQILTFLLSLGTAFFVYHIIRIQGSKKAIAILGALTLFFNPLFFASSFTFMTDNYLLFFLSAASYFFIRYLKMDSYKDLFVSSLFGFLAAMTRQNGALIFVPMIVLGFTAPKDKIKKILVPTIFLVISIFGSFVWPRFGVNKRFVEIEDFTVRLSTLLYAPQYLVIFLSPVLMGFTLELRGKN